MREMAATYLTEICTCRCGCLAMTARPEVGLPLCGRCVDGARPWDDNGKRKRKEHGASQYRFNLRKQPPEES